MPVLQDSDVYKAHYEHFGRLNDILYRMPVVYSTILGALWYFAVTMLEKDRYVSIAVFFFSAVLSFIFDVITKRFSLAFNAYIDSINTFDGDRAISIKGKTRISSVRAIRIALASAGLISVLGIVYSFLPIAVQLICRSAQ